MTKVKTMKKETKATTETSYPRFYIAYGSNMSFEQMGWRCKESTLVGAGIVEGYELLFKGSLTGNYATIEPKETTNVPVLVWSISERDELKLDRYEGCPKFYYKTILPVKMADGATIDGIVYIMHEERKCGLPDKGYIGLLREAYRRFGWDEEIIDAALVVSYNRSPRRQHAKKAPAKKASATKE